MLLRTSRPFVFVDGIDGLLTEQEARLAVLQERRRIYGHDDVSDEQMRRVEREIDGHDLYLLRLQRAFDGESDDSLDDGQLTGHDSSGDSSLDGRDLWIQHLEKLDKRY